jgi:hypothetical protein
MTHGAEQLFSAALSTFLWWQMAKIAMCRFYRELPARLPWWSSCFSAALSTFLWRQMAKLAHVQIL